MILMRWNFAEEIVSVHDSESNSVLVRAVDRRAAERQSMAFPSNSVSNWVEVKRLAQYWARLLREHLDQIAEEMTLQEDAA